MILVKLLRTSAAALGTLAVASVTQANAADIYSGGGGYKDVPVVQPCCTFTGFYIGANAGIAFSRLDLDNNHFFDGYWNYYDSGRGKMDGQNGFIGGQLGFNWQNSCCFVYGLEVDLDYVGLHNRNNRFANTNNSYPLNGVGWDDKMDGGFGGDVTGRLGYTFGSSMVYVKGGFAFLDVSRRENENWYWSDGTTSTYGNNNNGNWLTGWTVGAGIEWKPCCQGNWSIKAEYLHFDFSNNNDHCCGDPVYTIYGYNNFRNNSDLQVDTVKIGFNYFLNASPAVAAPLK